VVTTEWPSLPTYRVPSPNRSSCIHCHEPRVNIRRKSSATSENNPYCRRQRLETFSKKSSIVSKKSNRQHPLRATWRMAAYQSPSRGQVRTKESGFESIRRIADYKHIIVCCRQGGGLCLTFRVPDVVELCGCLRRRALPL
jgi:hypothetical protein